MKEYQILTAAIVGMARHMGSRTIFLVEVFIQERIFPAHTGNRSRSSHPRTTMAKVTGLLFSFTARGNFRGIMEFRIRSGDVINGAEWKTDRFRWL